MNTFPVVILIAALVVGYLLLKRRRKVTPRQEPTIGREATPFVT